MLLAAAVCDHHDWTEKSVIGHKEWSSWKTDPGRMNMVRFRERVARRLREGPPGEVEWTSSSADLAGWRPPW